MMTSHTLLAASLLAVTLAAQGDATKSDASTPQQRRSLADGLVRELVESQRMRPPRCDAGLELAAGDGPLALLVRRADGSLEVRALQRGLGDHGEAPAIAQATVPDEVEEGAAAAPAGKDKGKDKGADGRAPKKVELARLELRLAKPGAGKEGEPVRRDLVIGTGLVAERLRGEQLDRAALAGLLAELCAATKDSAAAGQLLVDAHPEVAYQDVLTTAELARAAGFTSVFFGGIASGLRQLSAEDRQVVLDMPADLGWKVQRKLNGVVPIHDGEVLVLVDGPAQWGDIAPIYVLCAKAGVWRISLVGQKDMATRFKVPTNLPIDRGQ